MSVKSNDLKNDFTKTVAWKVVFVITLTVAFSFMILYIKELIIKETVCLENAYASLTCQKAVRYNVKWEFTWQNDVDSQHLFNGDNTPPVVFVGPSVGVTNLKNQTPFWQFGSLASDGLKSLVEDGATTILEKELETKGVQFFSTPKTVGGVTSSVISMNVGANMVKATLAAQLNPSPGWFVGVSGVLLCDEYENWINLVSFPLMPINAGTTTDTSFIPPTTPADPPDGISYLKGDLLDTLFNGFPIGTVTFQRIPTL